jgi:hypothetical protein
MHRKVAAARLLKFHSTFPSDSSPLNAALFSTSTIARVWTFSRSCFSSCASTELVSMCWASWPNSFFCSILAVMAVRVEGVMT